MYEELLKTDGEKQFSHRNDVYLVESCGARCIRKRYLQENVSQTELETLRALAAAGVAVPEVLYFDGERMLLEYIDGPTYEGVLRGYEEGSLSGAEAACAARKMADWLFAYYAALGRLRGDVNFRNFIWSGGRCVGVDFEEETPPGPREEDMGRMLTYAATYRPICSEKKRVFCALLLERFLAGGADMRLIRENALSEVEAMGRRRSSFLESAPAVRIFIEGLFGDKEET